ILDIYKIYQLNNNNNNKKLYKFYYSLNNYKQLLEYENEDKCRRINFFHFYHILEIYVDTVKQCDGYLDNELLNIISIYNIDDIDFNYYYIQLNLDQQLINNNDFIWKLLSQHYLSLYRYYTIK
ncbi:unnamed protein product, partial [Rotaria sordida]